jgi:hypothetical protein
MDIWKTRRKCRKRKYHTPVYAYHFKLKYEKQYGTEMFIYYCINCDYYHLTSDQFHNQIPNYNEAFNETPSFTKRGPSHIAAYAQARRKSLFLGSRSIYLWLVELYGNQALRYPGRSLQRNRKVLR